MGAWTDIRFPTYQEAAMNCTEEFIAKMKQKDIVINFVQAWRNDTLEESYARLDFIVTKDEKIYCLEANTLPGMTPTSLIPQEAAVLGMDYPTLCEELIKVSQKKYA